MPRKKKKKSGKPRVSHDSTVDAVMKKVLAYDGKPEQLSMKDIEELLRSIPVATNKLEKEILAAKNEIQLYDDVALQLGVALEMLRLHETKSKLLKTATSISLHLCKRYEVSAKEKERLYDELIENHKRNAQKHYFV